ncbi:hypothetical protein C8R45DRAFT_813446, partial [Mycena sanguinolenta]
MVRKDPNVISRYNASQYQKQKVAGIKPSTARLTVDAETVSRQARLHRYTRRFEQHSLHGARFPPEPLADKDLHRILTNSAKAVQTNHFIESGCAVCGRLTPVSQLTLLSEFRPPLDCLKVKGVTRQPRHLSAEPITEIEGPVLAEGCDAVCVECEGSLLKGKIPKFALANHGWLGAVPPQLAGLSYAEQVMIAKVRHNRCVMRVNSGRVRMHANAIMFPQPVVKVYHKLPPSQEELSEVLAFVFTGSSQPTEEDFERTPMLVRKRRVIEALEWLKLNHEGYKDMEISLENLASYKHANIPVVVDYRKTHATADDSMPAEARSVNDAGEEYGTSAGPCSFAVHGFTDAQYSH